MSQNFPMLSVEIGEQSLCAGDSADLSQNFFELVITNSGPPYNGNLYLTGTLSSGPTALFLDRKDASSCSISLPSESWTVSDWESPSGSPDILKLSFSVFEFQGKAKIRFSRILSRTDPGEAELFLATDSTEPQKLPGLKKSGPAQQIVRFESTPPADETYFPGSSFQLHWSTSNLQSIELRRNGELVHGLEQKADFYDTGPQFPPARFTLSAPGAQKTIPSLFWEINLNFYEAGWRFEILALTEGQSGYPQGRSERIDLEPTEFFNANNTALYGIFRYRQGDRKGALLYRTTRPRSQWQYHASVPDGYEDSPGIYFDDHLWLIGGSQIDPARTSNEIWRLDPNGDGRTWQKLGPATWAPRMGHAVLEFENEIWVMGGFDESGNALDDIWAWSTANRAWTNKNELKLPSVSGAPRPRCLFQPTVFGNKIWLYGGMEEPFGEKLYDDLHVYTAGAKDWQLVDASRIHYPFSAPNKDAAPLASALVAFRGNLFFFGNFSIQQESGSSKRIEMHVMRLKDPNSNSWETFSVDYKDFWNIANTTSYQVMNFNDQFLLARLLRYSYTNSPPNYAVLTYIPGDIKRS